MRYCPSCAAGHPDGAAVCSGCGAPLVDGDTFRQMGEARRQEADVQFVAVKTVDDQFAAEVIRNALEQEGIPVLVRCFADTPFDGIFIAQHGWGMILVPGQFRTEAENIIGLLD